MATYPEARIAQLLFSRTVELATALQLPLSWRGWNFDVPNSRKWLRAEHFPNETARRFIGSDEPHRYFGILQIAVQWPHDRGEMEVREKAGQVVAHFPCDHHLNDDVLSVRITERPSAAELMETDEDMSIPVSIEYECWA